MRTSTEITEKLNACLKHSYLAEIVNDFFNDLKEATKERDVANSFKSVIYKWKLACKEVNHKGLDESFPISLVAFQANSRNISAKDIKRVYGIDITAIKHCDIAAIVEIMFL